MAVKKVIQKEADEATEVASRVYEVGYHIIPTFKEEDLDTIVSAIRAIIEKHSGSFVAEGAPVLTRLAYPIAINTRGKNDEYDRAYFGWIKFEAAPEAALALEEALKRDPAVIRAMVFRTVREETRARIKLATLREVRRTDTIKAAPKKEEGESVAVSEEDLDKAIGDLTAE